MKGDRRNGGLGRVRAWAFRDRLGGVVVTACVIGFAATPAHAELLTGEQERLADAEFDTLVSALERVQTAKASAQGVGVASRRDSAWLALSKLSRALDEAARARGLRRRATLGAAGALGQLGMLLLKGATFPVVAVAFALKARVASFVARDASDFAEAQVAYWAARAGQPIGANLGRRVSGALAQELNGAQFDRRTARCQLQELSADAVARSSATSARWRAELHRSQRKVAHLRRMQRALHLAIR